MLDLYENQIAISYLSGICNIFSRQLAHDTTCIKLNCLSTKIIEEGRVNLKPGDFGLQIDCSTAGKN